VLAEIPTTALINILHLLAKAYDNEQSHFYFYLPFII